MNLKCSQYREAVVCIYEPFICIYLAIPKSRYIFDVKIDIEFLWIHHQLARFMAETFAFCSAISLECDTELAPVLIYCVSEWKIGLKCEVWISPEKSNYKEDDFIWLKTSIDIRFYLLYKKENGLYNRKRLCSLKSYIPGKRIKKLIEMLVSNEIKNQQLHKNRNVLKFSSSNFLEPPDIVIRMISVQLGWKTPTKNASYAFSLLACSPIY